MPESTHDFWIVGPTHDPLYQSLHAAEEALFVRDANLLKAKSLRCLFTRQVTTNWTSWETTWSKEATIENMEYIFAAIPQKGSKARLIKRVPGEPSGIQEVFIIRTLEALNFLKSIQRDPSIRLR